MSIREIIHLNKAVFLIVKNSSALICKNFNSFGKEDLPASGLCSPDERTRSKFCGTDESSVGQVKVQTGQMDKKETE